MRSFLLCTIAALSILFTPHAYAEMPTTQQVEEPLADKGVTAGYEQEVFRQVNEKNEIVTTLRNGLTVIIKRVPSKVVTVRCHVRTGSVYEGKWLGGGLSHLLEHLVAGGSSQRRSEAENRNLLQKIGNNSNAYTTFDETQFFVNTTTDHLEDAVDLVTGWVFGALITPDEYKREYQVVQRELEMGKGSPIGMFADLSYSNRYRVSPARVPIIGYQEVIQGLSRDDVYGYYKLAYQPQNMVMGLAGDIEPEKMLAAVQKFVGDVKPGRGFSHDIPAEPAVVSPRTVVGTFPKLGHAMLEIGFPTVRLDSPDLYALDLLASVLGDGYGALLIETLRDEKQLITEVTVGNDTPAYVDGTFGMIFTLSPDKIHGATDALMDVLEEVKRRGVDPDRLKRAKTQMKVSRFRGMQTTDDVSAAMVDDYITTGDPHFREHYIERIQKVTNTQIKEVAKKYFDRNKLITTCLMPAEDPAVATLPKAEDLLRAAAQGVEKPAEPKPDMAKAERIVLPNGTVLLVKRMAASPMVSMQMMALGGLSVEDEKNNGIGNLAMAMIQRGTDNNSAVDVAEVFDSIGGEINTQCARNDWAWSATCLGEDFEKAFTTWASIINKPRFDPQELPTMKQRIAADIKSQDADWEQQAIRFFRRSFFGPSKLPYQFLAPGSLENLDRFTTDDARQFYFGTILKSPRVLAVYGDVDPERVKDLARRLLGDGDKLPAVPKLNPPPVPAEPANQKPMVNVVRVEVQKTDQALAGVVLGFESHSVIGDADKPSLTVANAMVSGYGYPTGYLFETLRGLGLVYTTYAFDLTGRNKELPGAFVAVAGCDPSNVTQVTDLMLLNIARLQGTPADLQEDWFARSKQMIVISDAMDQETAEAQATIAVEDELMGLGFDDASRFPGKIAAVKIGDIGQVARRQLRLCVVTICTPQPELVKIPTGERSYDIFPSVDLTPKGVKHDSKSPQPGLLTPPASP